MDRFVPLLARGSATLFWSSMNPSVISSRTYATCLQLAARTLALLAEEMYQDPRLAAAFDTVAAGLSVLEQRADGTIVPSETIVLARA